MCSHFPGPKNQKATLVFSQGMNSSHFFAVVHSLGQHFNESRVGGVVGGEMEKPVKKQLKVVGQK